MEAISYSEALKRAARQLQGVALHGARMEAEILLAHLLDKQRTHLYAWPDNKLDSEMNTRFKELVSRRSNGEPIAYILGYKEFWSLELEVNPSVLIPRPETELLVEIALSHLPPDHPCFAADLGTGSGAIAAAIASERPSTKVVAVERSTLSLETANMNFQRLGLQNIEPRNGSWCDVFNEGERFDLIASNPPYVSNSDPHLDKGDLPAEPIEALASGDDGLNDIRTILHCAPNHLKPGGHLLIEHGYDQGNAVRKLFGQTGLQQIHTHQDLEGRDRLTEGTKS